MYVGAASFSSPRPVARFLISCLHISPRKGKVSTLFALFSCSSPVPATSCFALSLSLSLPSRLLSLAHSGIRDQRPLLKSRKALCSALRCRKKRIIQSSEEKWLGSTISSSTVYGGCAASLDGGALFLSHFITYSPPNPLDSLPHSVIARTPSLPLQSPSSTHRAHVPELFLRQQ